MTVATIVGGGVELSTTGIRIDGEPRMLLCASLFYFRLPREEWADRLAQVRASGYTCIDVYFPWNFHEIAPGEWSFTGRRDLAAFVDLAHEAGLHVIARPGPYICSEWDGGGLPAWLTLDDGLRVRQHEPRFLAQVERWFDRVLPLLAERQHPDGGPVIMVQLENELDFFDCADRAGYLGALRDLALAHGIRVPLIACAGQGDLPGATGDVPGVVPACNFYPEDDSPDIEADVRHYARLLGARGLPLLITETNRSHRTLRRLLAAGASLLGPYLQASGWNFGFTPSAGNWGAPGNFFTHSYDLGGYVTPAGVERAGFAEARVLTRVVSTLGEALAEAVPAGTPTYVDADFPTSSAPAALDLAGGGRLLALPNLGDSAGTAVVGPGVTVPVAADSCPLMLADLPLHRWGVSATLSLASADLVASSSDSGRLALAFSSAVPVVVVLDGLRTGAGDRVTVAVPAGERQVVAGVDRDGREVTVTLVGLSPSAAARLERLAPDGTVLAVRDGSQAYEKRTVTDVATVTRRGGVAPSRNAGVLAQPPALEAFGVYRGRGSYATLADLTGVESLLLVGAADLVDLTIGGRTRETLAGFGAAELVDVRDETGETALHATVEIWGHANFDDARLPALGLGALRGLGTVWAVTGTRDIRAHWTVSGDGQWAGDPAPIRSLGGWSSTRLGAPITYTRRLDIPSVQALHLDGLAVPVTVVIDGGPPEVVTGDDPWLLLPAGAGRVALTLPHDPSGAPVRASVLTLRPVTGWDCTAQDDAVLLDYACDGAPGSDSADLPLSPAAGDEIWVDVDVPPCAGGWLVQLAGTQLRATGWAAGECLGRVWLGDPRRPRQAGGDPEVLWIPGAWAASGARLTLLLRGTAGAGSPELTAIRLVEARPAGAAGRPGPLSGSRAQRLTPDDAAEVTVLQRCCWVEEALANDTLAIPALHESPADVRDWLADWDTTGIRLDGRLVAMVRTRPDGANLDLGRLAVVPDLRGRGLARWLLRAVEAGAGPGIRRIVLFTGTKSARNIDLYQSEGYRPASLPSPPGTVCLAKEIGLVLPVTGAAEPSVPGPASPVPPG